MTTEEQQTRESTGFSRRAALKAAAWSVPVVAAAAAVPAYAASGDLIDLKVQEQPFGESIGGISPDRLRSWSLGLAGAVEISNVGTSNLPAGALYVTSFDSRILGDPSPRLGSLEGTPLVAAGTTTTGNVTTASFLLPAIAAGASIEVYRGFGRWPNPENDNWYEDIEPYVVSVSAVGESNTADNSVTSPARYTDTVDAALSVAWGTKEIPNQVAGAPAYVIDVPQTITIDSLTPGGTSNSIHFMFAGPRVWMEGAGEAPNENWVSAFTGATITSALLDGVDVLSEISDESHAAPDYFGNFWFRNTSMTAGQRLVITLDVAVQAGPVGGTSPNGGAYAQCAFYPDRDESNNRVDSPQYTAA